MALKVAASDSKAKSSTDLVRFLYPDADQRIQLSFFCSPQVMIFPTEQSDGVIRVNRAKSIPIRKDGHFMYGGWPQTRVSPIQSRKLTEILKQNRLTMAGHYYDLGGQACQEYEWNKKRYVLIPNTGKWFQVEPIEWVYDFKTKTVHSYRAIWSRDESSPKKFASFGWQALQSNKWLFQNQNNSSPERSQSLRMAESDMIHAIRFLRDEEKKAGITSGKGKKMLELLRATFYQGRNK